MDFEKIYRAYFHDVYLYMRSLGLNEGAAEEITQEAFFKAIKSIHQYDGKKDIRAWLFTIAKNTYFTQYKKQQRQQNSQPEQSVLDFKLVEHLMDDETAFTIHEYLHTMDDPYKEVFSLRTFGELSYEKIGKLFGKSDSWARVTFFRAKKKILEHMEARNDD